MQASQVPYPIVNKYTFACVFSQERNVRPLLEEVMGIPIGRIRIVEPEHVIESSLRGRGVRMDVYAADGTGTVYDVEMQNADEGDLELRSRYLLSSFDRDRIRRGHPYTELGATVVIFVCRFDPIGLGQRMYVVRPMVEGHGVTFEDGTMRVFLNARGAAGCAPERLAGVGSPRLAAFLSFVDGGDTMGDEWVEGLDGEVRALNEDEGWRSAMLGIELDHRMEVYRAEQRGREEGMKAGREEGQEQSLDLLARLATALSADGRQDELVRAALDRGLFGRLCEEYGIS